jgi:hypothetical protein
MDLPSNHRLKIISLCGTGASRIIPQIYGRKMGLDHPNFPIPEFIEREHGKEISNWALV